MRRQSTQNSLNTQSQKISAISAVSALIVMLVTGCLLGQVAAPAAPTFDSNRAWGHLGQIVTLGPRPAGSAALEQTRKYIRTQMAAAGIAVTEQAWDAQTPIGTV